MTWDDDVHGEHFEIPSQIVASHLPGALANNVYLLSEDASLIVRIVDLEDDEHHFKHIHLDRVEPDHHTHHYRVILKNGMVILCSAGAIVAAVVKIRTHSKHRRR